MQTINTKTETQTPIIQLNKLIEQNFTGSLSIRAADNLNWKLYFRLGRLIWSIGAESYASQQWQRHIELFFSSINERNKAILLNQKPDQYYKVLAHLYREGNPAQKKKITELITSILVEVVFDLIQIDTIDPKQLSYKLVDNDKPETLITLIKTDLVCQQASAKWQEWVAGGLTAYSPNLFPAIEHLKIFQEKVRDNFNSQFIPLIDGKTSLRTLAVKSRLNLVSLTQDLMPAFEIKAISLNRFPSLKKIAVNPSIFSQINSAQNNSFLVVCVDDSPVICEDLERVIAGSYYRFISIQDPLQAMPLLIRNSPDFIFLDVIMPIVNGYELCGQLRKTLNFQNVPIAILTGKDGLVDRMRAKLAGATEFISKPVNPQEVMTLLNKYLLTK